MASASAGKRSKKALDFDLNLVPFIDVLATCICFLLMTTIWIHLKGIGVKQSIGSESQNDDKNPASIEATFSQTNGLVFSLKNIHKAPSQLNNVAFRAGTDGYDWTRIEQYLGTVKEALPGLKMGMVIPKSDSKYQDLVQLMGLFKKNKFGEVGISPY